MVAVEDERFYQHNGVDLDRAVPRASWSNLTKGFGEEGASTITQQYIRNTILLDERTRSHSPAKVREAYLAMELEKRYDKQQILEMYLNTVYFGDGAYGAEAASRTYFGKKRRGAHLGGGRAARRPATAAEPARPLEQPRGRRSPA